MDGPATLPFPLPGSLGACMSTESARRGPAASGRKGKGEVVNKEADRLGPSCTSYGLLGRSAAGAEECSQMPKWPCIEARLPSAALAHAPQVMGLLMPRAGLVSPPLSTPPPRPGVSSRCFPAWEQVPGQCDAPPPVTLFSYPCRPFLGSVQNALAWKHKQDYQAVLNQDFCSRQGFSVQKLLTAVGNI